MKRLIAAYSPKGCPVRIENLVCVYQPYKEATTLYAGKPEGVFASVNFGVVSVTRRGSRNNILDVVLNKKGDDKSKSLVGGPEKDRVVTSVSRFKGLEAVEFTIVLLDIFDNFLASVQGLAGPGKFLGAKKVHRMQWVFDVDGAFSQYHAICVPSQARYLDGTIWRCDRDECAKWVNKAIKDSGFSIKVEDIFLDGGMHEGISEQK